MRNVEFLPSRFKVEEKRRKYRYWHLLTTFTFAAALLASTRYQYYLRDKIDVELGALQQRYDQSARRHNKINKLKKDIELVDAEAELITYLKHPWQRSRILHILIGSLPESITFEELSFVQQKISVGNPNLVRTRVDAKKEKAAEQLLPAWAKDLKTLRKECDLKRDVILITGETTDTIELQDYVGKLLENRLIKSAEASSRLATVRAQRFDADTLGPAIYKFDVRIVLVPGFGQPDGPNVERSLASHN